MTTPVLGPVVAQDAGELLTLQRAAFVSEAQVYDDPRHPALTQTLDELRAELRTVRAYKAVLGTRMVGAVRVRREGPILHLSRLVVAPDLQGSGIGSALLRHVEEQAEPDVTLLALFTGARSEGNLRLYRRHGYVFRRDQVLPGGIELVHLDKALR